MKTIYDMLKRAFVLVRENAEFCAFLESIDESIESLGIRQRFTKIAHKQGLITLCKESQSKESATYLCFNDEIYRAVKFSESKIYVLFDEKFTQIQGVEVSSFFFLSHLRVQRQRAFCWLEGDEKIALLSRLFGCFDEFGKCAAECIYVHNDYFIERSCLSLKRDAKVKRGVQIAYYKASSEYPHFVFPCDKFSINSAILMLKAPQNSRKNCDEWFKQRVISLNFYYEKYLLEFGEETSFDKLKKGEFLVSFDLEKRLENLRQSYEEQYFDETLNYKKFYELGMILYTELQEALKDEFIVLYEGFGDENNVDMDVALDVGLDADLKICVSAKRGGTGLWQLDTPLKIPLKNELKYENEMFKLSENLKNKFKKWQENFTKNSHKFSEAERENFDIQGIKLAKDLKEFLIENLDKKYYEIYVEYQGQNVMPL